MPNQRTDYEPMLGNFPKSCPERWRTIREFIRNWHGVALPDIGGQKPRIKEIEASLGYSLPLSCREWIALFFDLIDAGGYERVFRDSLSLEEVKGHPAFSLLMQGEGDYHWAVWKKHLARNDPPVDGFQLDYEDTELPFIHHQLWSPSVSSWAFGFILTYLYISAQCFSTTVDDATKLALQLKRHFPSSLDLGKVQVFEARNVLVVLTTDWFSPGQQLSVNVWKTIPRREIPDFLWKYTKNGGAFSGMFAKGK